MHRAYDFISDLNDEILKIKGKGLGSLSKVEIDTLLLLHDLHESSCEYVIRQEKHEGMEKPAYTDNPRRRR